MPDTISKKAIYAMCHARCRVVVRSENGHLIDIEEDASFPRAGKVCPPVKACLRSRGTKEWMYHPDRLNYPRKRIGEKGSGKWQIIPWDQAFDEIAAKLLDLKEKYGLETLSFTGGTGRAHHGYALRFANLFGTPNHTGPGMVCHGPINVMAQQAMCGWALRHRTGLTIEYGIDKTPLTRCIMLAGINPAQSVPRLWHTLRKCRGAGVKVIVIDRYKLQAYSVRDLIQAAIMKMWGVRCGTAPSCAIAHAPTVHRAMLSGKPYPVRAALHREQQSLDHDAQYKTHSPGDPVNGGWPLKTGLCKITKAEQT